ncbi:vacuolar protein [Cyanidiococcus yangmingshanensis]|uniref:Vacuolar protein n=1 Tax=Cyanidiococcus yangmingshanensis TaxID=2690220 RepID=A0A7J7IIT9_9RHOD|nr:vacuolar protein [Cyanidiococcus yangmingshanensis]
MPADICVSETQNRSQTDTEEKKIMESSVEAPATPQSSSSTLTGQHEVSASILSEAHRTASSTDVRASTERFEDVSDQVSEQVTGNATDDQALSTNANTFGHDTSTPLYEHEWDPSTFLEIFERSAWIQCFRKIRIRLHRIWIRIEADPDQSGGSACNASVSPWTMEVSLEEALLEPPDDAFRAQVHEHCALSFPNPNPEDGISHDTSLFLWRGHCLRGLRVRVTVDDERWLPLLTKTSGRDPWTRTAPLRSVDWSWLWQRLRNREMTSYLIRTWSCSLEWASTCRRWRILGHLR